MKKNGTYITCITLILITTQGTAQVDRITGKIHATRSEIIGENGMVATSQPLATQIGLDILKQGGNAIDAAIAANAALGLMEPTGCGIGGDLFAIIWDAKHRKLHGLNASGRSPKALSYQQLQQELTKLDRESIPPHGLLPISVPGAVDGWFQLHQRFGSLPMEKILQAPIHYAENGFPVSELIAYYWGLSIPHLSQQPGAYKQTFTLNGRAPKKGERFKNPDLANTYRILAKKGRDAFYKGEIADKIDAFMREHNGYLHKQDLLEHHSDWVEPQSVDYRGYRVYELPPNGQGIAVLQMLNILETYDLKVMGHNSAETLHLMIEAKKLVYEDRAKFYADMDFNTVPLKSLLSKQYAAARRKLIGTTAAHRVDSGNPALSQGDTIYLTTADKHGNMVSLIQSNYRGMGSGIVVPGTGFGLQDRGELFSMDTQHANAYAPGKRPFHTIIPAFITKDGKPYISFGVMGGALQPQGHVQIITNLIDFGMNLQEAGDAPRWQHLGSTEPTSNQSAYLTGGGYIEFESGIDYQTLRDLMQKGHDARYGLGGYGGYQAIMWDSKLEVYFGASESRKDGQAAGY